MTLNKGSVSQFVYADGLKDHYSSFTQTVRPCTLSADFTTHRLFSAVAANTHLGGHKINLKTFCIVSMRMPEINLSLRVKCVDSAHLALQTELQRLTKVKVSSA